MHAQLPHSPPTPDAGGMVSQFSRLLSGLEARLNRPGPKAFALSALLICVTTLVGFGWVAALGPRNLSLLFFAGILCAGVWLGMRPALFAAALAFLSYNFFLVEPRFSFRFAPADVLALVTFLVGALLVGGLAGRLSDRARDAAARLRDVTLLYEASRDLSGAVEPADAAMRLLIHLEARGAQAAIWIEQGEGQFLRKASESARSLTLSLETIIPDFLGSAEDRRVGDGGMLVHLRAGDRVLGAVALWPLASSRAASHDRRWIDALLELGAVAIDRARLIAEVAETRVVAEKEGLRTALLSSLSHDLRTPISTILASTTSLIEHEGRFDVATRGDLLDTIQTETERLNRYVANLLEMTRLESGALTVRRALIDPGEAMASAIGRVERNLKDKRMLRAFQNCGVRISVDPVLIEQALTNVLENALTHAPADSTIMARVETAGALVLLSIEDEGPGIPAGEVERVFDKFFRGRSDRRPASGVGLGLSVTRGLIESFGGTVRAISPAVGGKGARIEIRLPAHPALETVE